MCSKRKRVFESLSSKDLTTLQSNEYSKNTNYSTTTHLNAFTQFINGQGVLLNNVSKQNLDPLLCSFYGSVKKIDGASYKSSTLLTMRQSTRRHFKSDLNVDILRILQNRD